MFPENNRIVYSYKGTYPEPWVVGVFTKDFRILSLCILFLIQIRPKGTSCLVNFDLSQLAQASGRANMAWFHQKLLQKEKINEEGGIVLFFKHLGTAIPYSSQLQIAFLPCTEELKQCLSYFGKNWWSRKLPKGLNGIFHLAQIISATKA